MYLYSFIVILIDRFAYFLKVFLRAIALKELQVLVIYALAKDVVGSILLGSSL